VFSEAWRLGPWRRARAGIRRLERRRLSVDKRDIARALVSLACAATTYSAARAFTILGAATAHSPQRSFLGARAAIRRALVFFENTRG
jgi:hypothetical protein